MSGKVISATPTSKPEKGKLPHPSHTKDELTEYQRKAYAKMRLRLARRTLQKKQNFKKIYPAEPGMGVFIARGSRADEIIYDENNKPLYLDCSRVNARPVLAYHDPLQKRFTHRMDAIFYASTKVPLTSKTKKEDLYLNLITASLKDISLAKCRGVNDIFPLLEIEQQLYEEEQKEAADNIESLKYKGISFLLNNSDKPQMLRLLATMLMNYDSSKEEGVPSLLHETMINRHTEEAQKEAGRG